MENSAQQDTEKLHPKDSIISQHSNSGPNVPAYLSRITGLLRFLIFIVGVISTSLLLISLYPNAQYPKVFQRSSSKPYSDTLILISIDGFKAEYLSRGITPNLSKMARSGILLDMYPSFPSITFPNHYTLVTGLYPESHGIVGNVFYDPALNDTFVYTRKEKSWDSKWWGGEPIWVTAEMAQKKTAIYMWPGSTSVIKNTAPSYMIPFENNVHPNKKFAKLIEWLQLPSGKRPQLLATYIPEVDQVGHKCGPNSKHVEHSIAMVDRAVGRFMCELQKHNLYNKVNIVVVSDHGMTPSQIPKYVYYIEDLLSKAGMSNLEQQNVICGLFLWPFGGVKLCNDADTENVYKRLKSVENPKVWRVFKRADIPEKYHYSNNLRIPSILIETFAPYIIDTRGKTFKDSVYYASQFNQNPGLSSNSGSRFSSNTIGVHGYDNFSEDMRALFLAHGPKFSRKLCHKKNKTHSLLSKISRPVKKVLGYMYKPSRHNSPNTASPHNKAVSRKTTMQHRKHLKQINNVEVYGIIAKVLGVTPAPNNGTVSIANQIVVDLSF